MSGFRNDFGATVAWGDESLRMHGTPPIYLMCATIFGESAEEDLRPLVAGEPRGMRKLHWYDMNGREKRRSLEALAEVPHWSAVAIASPMIASIRPERGRRKCLERLLPELEGNGVGLLKLESRWKQEDQADVDMVVALRNRRMIERIQVEHVKPDAGEPRLWVPDQVLGPIGDILCGSPDMSWWSKAWDKLDPRVAIYPAALLS